MNSPEGNTNIEVTPSSLPSVRANHALLLEVVECLIRNALDAMPSGGLLSIQGGTTMLHDHPELWLQFCDTGHGIPQEVLKDLFTPFFTTKKDGHSLGIGLWLARLYLQTLGGDIEATSVAGQGSTFTLRLPVMQDTARKIDQATSLATPQTDQFQGAHPGESEQANVLIVEDDPSWQGLLSAMLLGHNVQT